VTDSFIFEDYCAEIELPLERILPWLTG